MTVASIAARASGLALIVGALVTIAAEAIAASAWNLRPYSYADDYVNFLGSPFVGTFEGIVISSPLWMVMSIGWVLSGILIAMGAIRLGLFVPRRRRIWIIAIATLEAVGLILFATVPLGPETVASGRLGIYLTGAFLSVIAGNALIVVLASAWRQLGIPRPAAVATIVIGIVGLVSIPVTYGWAPIGIAERISVYTFLGGAILIGIALLARRRRLAAGI